MTRSDNLTGAILMMASMASFTINDTFMKALAGEIPLFQVLFLRGIFTTIAVAGIAWWMGALFARVSRRDAGSIALRMVGEIGSAYFFLTALFNMPIANVTAILQALPLTITLAAALVFGDPIGWRRMSAILIGLVGVMLIVRPGAEDFTIYSIYALIAVGVPILGYVTYQNGPWIGLAVLLGGMSLLRWPVIYLGRWLRRNVGNKDADA